MDRNLPGAFGLFKAFGIDVQVHWTWFVVAAVQMSNAHLFGSVWFHLVLYLSLFGIVLLHEFGHALACRSVGGQANRIVLWPLGGIAFVRPPMRPGAVLWSIAAGPLVNVLLVPVTIVIYVLVARVGGGGGRLAAMSDPERVAYVLCYLNLGILLFNLLPVYPLDGGQILQSLLWFVVGLGRSLQIVTVIGMSTAVLSGVLAVWAGRWWLVLMAVFIGWQSRVGYRNARVLLLLQRQAGV